MFGLLNMRLWDADDILTLGIIKGFRAQIIKQIFTATYERRKKQKIGYSIYSCDFIGS